jgi:hypothetical protein
MRTAVVIFALLVGAFTAIARDVRLFIALQTSVVPRSGKVAFDIYWINDGERPAAIPLLECYSFWYSPLGPGSTVVAIESRIVDHPGRDRQLGPRQALHERATAEITSKGAQPVEVAAEFRGNRSTYKSNTVVLRLLR